MNSLKILDILELQIKNGVFHKVVVEQTRKEMMLSITEDYLLNIDQLSRLIYQKEIDELNDKKIKELCDFLLFCSKKQITKEDLSLIARMGDDLPSKNSLEAEDLKIRTKNYFLEVSLNFEATENYNYDVTLALKNDRFNSEKSLGLYYAYELPLLVSFLKEIACVLNDFNALLDEKGMKGREELPDVWASMTPSGEVSSSIVINFGPHTSLLLELELDLDFTSSLKKRAHAEPKKRLFLKTKNNRKHVPFTNLKELDKELDFFEIDYLRF